MHKDTEEYKDLHCSLKLSLLFSLLITIPLNLLVISTLFRGSKPMILVILAADICLFFQIKSWIDFKNNRNLLKIKSYYEYFRGFYLFYFGVGLIPMFYMFSIPKEVDKLLTKINSENFDV